jgi:hypothetical protein
MQSQRSFFRRLSEYDEKSKVEENIENAKRTP